MLCGVLFGGHVLMSFHVFVLLRSLNLGEFVFDWIIFAMHFSCRVVEKFT